MDNIVNSDSHVNTPTNQETYNSQCGTPTTPPKNNNPTLEVRLNRGEMLLNESKEKVNEIFEHIMASSVESKL